MPRQRKPRIPKLAFTTNRNIGWHVSYRDPASGQPRRHRFGMIDESEARVQYHAWVAGHLNGDTQIVSLASTSGAERQKRAKRPSKPTAAIVPGSLIEVASSFLQYEESRVRKPELPRTRGSIDPAVYAYRRTHIRDFLAFLNRRHGDGAASRMVLVDLRMEDVEAYNRSLVDQGRSASDVGRRMQIIKNLIDRAGRPEHGQQTLPWNWDSRDLTHGKPTEERRLPTVDQLTRVLDQCDLRDKTIVWMAIGLGFGPRDLAVVRVGQIDKDAYDLRRSKTQIERYGDTPPLIASLCSEYIAKAKRKSGDLMFVTRNGKPLVHGQTNAIQQWWRKIREQIGETRETLDGFYTLRHIGATEFGSRPGCSISDMRRWLGHSASSRMADVYMRPIRPEYREVVTWTREHLKSPS